MYSLCSVTPYIWVKEKNIVYRKKKKIRITKNAVCMVLKALFVPPVSLAVWFGIASFCVICYLTAFGFD